MSDFRSRLFLSTTADDAPELARRHGLGLEIAEFCTAENMDARFQETDAAVREKMNGVSRFVFHAAFNELCPAAIDPLAVELTRRRYRQAIGLARSYGIRRIVIHSGYIPLVYFPVWFAEKSIAFWRDFIREVPQDMTVLYENVMEDSPDMLVDIVRAVDHPRFRLCLDVGHANTEVSRCPPEKWAEAFSPWLSHVHLHNNQGGWDLHAGLDDGTVPIKEIITRLEADCPGVTYTIENMHAAGSVDWLVEEGYLRT